MADYEPHPGRYDGKVAVVTGGASGIGLAIVRRLLAEGASVVAGDRSVDALRQLESALGERFAGVEIDVRAEADLERLVAMAVDRFGGVHAGFNCAGMAEGTNIVDLPLKAWSRVHDVVLTGVFLAVKHQARQMIAQGGGGAIVNIASVSGVVPAHGAAAYTVAKAGVVMLTQNAALELGDHRIRVNALAPGLVDTPMAASTGNMEPAIQALWLEHTPMGRIGRTDDIAAAAAFLASDEASWISGVNLFVDGGSQLTAAPDFRQAGPS
jgi:NAD(P)-dependent dehydrogenase (short-subunit alcohol dehydrogenase family)